MPSASCRTSGSESRSAGRIDLTRPLRLADKQTMKRAALLTQRLVVILAFGAAFVVMASIFVPGRTRAGDESDAARWPHRFNSTDPHEGLLALGTLENGRHRVQIYATESGPRYSIYDAGNGEELGVLMTAEKVAKLFPELPLPSMDFGTSGPLMYTEPSELDESAR